MAENISDIIEYDGLFLKTNSSIANKVIVNVKGRLETANSIHFLDHMTKLVEGSPHGCELILAMSELYYVSSTGIGAFTTILVISKKRNIKFYIKNMQPKVKSVLELLGFTAFFNFIEE
jgi:anti-sigma B factor antagonist